MAKKRLQKKMAKKTAVETLVKTGLTEKQARRVTTGNEEAVRRATELSNKMEKMQKQGVPEKIVEYIFNKDRGKNQGAFTGKREQNKIVLEYTRERLKEKGDAFFGLTPDEVRKVQKTPLNKIDKLIEKGEFINTKQRNQNWSALSAEANKAQRYWRAVKEGRPTSGIPKPNYKKSFNGVNLRQLENKADEINAKVGLPRGDSYGYAVLHDALTNGYTVEESMSRMEVDTSIPSHYVAVY